MKKINPEKELEKIKKVNLSSNNSKMSNLFIPLLIIGCSFIAMTAVTFSAYLEEDEKETYKIHIDIINGNEESYDKVIVEGPFRDTITSNNSFGSIECTSGLLEYDPITETVSAPYINRNTSCVIAFMDDGVKNINQAGLTSINDNKGISYYYKSDQENNYVLLKDQLYRIVRINGDGSIRLILNDNITSSVYGSTNQYYNSNIRTILEDWFNRNFYNESYIVESDYDISNYSEINTEDLINLEGYYISKVGTLSAREAELISKDTTSNYLTSSTGIYLSNGRDIDKAYAFKNNGIVPSPITEYLSIRPVININAKLIGSGTKNNPYTITE